MAQCCELEPVASPRLPSLGSAPSATGGGSSGSTAQAPAPAPARAAGPCTEHRVEPGEEEEVGREVGEPAVAMRRGIAPHEPHAAAEVFRGEWDDGGVCFYQAYNDQIADWALEHQRLGGPHFNPARMTWIKPSFAWVLYRSGYARKHNQSRILKVKLPHEAVAELLGRCQCKEGGGGSKGRVQWDPARDLMSADGRVPRMLLRDRAIQIGLKGDLSELYVRSALSIRDVTELARRVGRAHAAASTKEAMAELAPELPLERPYMPLCPEATLVRLRMLPPGDLAPQPRAGRGKKR